MIKILKISALCFTVFFFSCHKNGWKEMQMADTVYNSIKTKYAPDKREALFDIRMNYSNGEVHLQGESNLSKAVKELVNGLYASGLEVRNNIEMLPAEELDAKNYGIINNSVANIRSRPKHSAELATQALLGTVVDVLKRSGEWYLIQTPDKYLSWIDHGGLVLVKDQQGWLNSANIIYTAPSGYVYADPSVESGVVSDIVMGCQLKLKSETLDYYQVSYPDGRGGYVLKKDAGKYTEWLGLLKPSGDLLTREARKLTGSPYLWGGTSSKGMDCSGFTKTAYLMNGLIIPRDASLQIKAGKIVDESLTFEGLEKGDLVFFGKAATDSTKQKTTHVGLWLGDNEFMHSSRQVRISSIDPGKENYDEYNKTRYLGARRYLDNVIGNITDLRKSANL